MQLTNIALVGLGSVGRKHLRLLRELRPDISIVVVRSGLGDSSPEEAFATKIVSTVDEAIRYQVQAAIISSPASLHLKQAQCFIEAGIHVLVEKPLSHSMDGIKRLIDSVALRNLKGLVGYVLRYDPAAQHFRKCLQDPAIGQILHASIVCGSYLPEWRPQQDYRKTVSALKGLGGGALLELSHELDYMHWFFGFPTELQAQLTKSNTLEIDVEDSADLTFLSTHNFPVSMHLDFNRRIPTRVCKVQTVLGELLWDVLAKQVIWRRVGKPPEIETFDSERDHVYRVQLKHFFKCVEEDIIPLVTLHDGVAVIRIVEAAKLADKSGCRVRIS